MPVDKKISDFTASPGVDSTVILAGLQIIGGTVTDTRFAISQLKSYINPLSFPNVRTCISLAGETIAVHNFASYTSSTSGVFQLNSYIQLNSVSGATVSLKVSFTDINNNLQDLLLGSVATSPQYGILPSFTIRVKANTTIYLSSEISGGTANYDISSSIIQIAL